MWYNIILTLLIAGTWGLVALSRSSKFNFPQEWRPKQIFMPIVALIYGVIASILLSSIELLIRWLLSLLCSALDSWFSLNLSTYFDQQSSTSQFSTFLYIITNFLIGLTFIPFKAVYQKLTQPWFDKFYINWKFFRENLVLYFYDDKTPNQDKFDPQPSKNGFFLLSSFELISELWKTLYKSSIFAVLILLCIPVYFPSLWGASAVFLPVLLILFVSETQLFLAGEIEKPTQKESKSSNRESNQINFADIFKRFKTQFNSHILNSSLDEQIISSSGDLSQDLADLENDPNADLQFLATHLTKLQEAGIQLNREYIEFSKALIEKHNTIIYNPFYQDLSDYLVVPLYLTLVENYKILIIGGNQNSGDALVKWAKNMLNNFTNTIDFFSIGKFDRTHPELKDISIIDVGQLNDFTFFFDHRTELSEITTVLFLEPSKILNNNQIAINLLTETLTAENQINFIALDRKTEGVFDALSHLIKAPIQKVYTLTTKQPDLNALIIWDSRDSKTIQNQVIGPGGIDLGVGGPIGLQALAYGVKRLKWLTDSKLWVNDIHRLLTGYIRSIRAESGNYLDQKELADRFTCSDILYNETQSSDQFFILEDEYNNFCEIIPLFFTRASQQVLCCVISENYLLRDYISDNMHLFLKDSTILGSFTPDYIRSERNSVIELTAKLLHSTVPENKIRLFFDTNHIGYPQEQLDDVEIARRIEKLIAKYFPNNNHAQVISIAKTEYNYIEDKEQDQHFFSLRHDDILSSAFDALKPLVLITEDEKIDSQHYGYELQGQIYQKYLPGTYVTIKGSNYEVQNAQVQGEGVIFKRSYDLLTAHTRYRQIRRCNLTAFEKLDAVGSSVIFNGLEILQGMANFQVSTDGYLELSSLEQLATCHLIEMADIPIRSYNNKEVLVFKFSEEHKEILLTLALTLNEIVYSILPDSHPYLRIVTPEPNRASNNTIYLLDHLDLAESVSESLVNSLIVIEDSQHDLGLLQAFAKNWRHIFSIAYSYLKWVSTQPPSPPDANPEPDLDETLTNNNLPPETLPTTTNQTRMPEIEPADESESADASTGTELDPATESDTSDSSIEPEIEPADVATWTEVEPADVATWRERGPATEGEPADTSTWPEIEPIDPSVWAEIEPATESEPTDATPGNELDQTTGVPWANPDPAIETEPADIELEPHDSTNQIDSSQETNQADTASPDQEDNHES